jgi:dynein light chain LC8-type
LPEQQVDAVVNHVLTALDNPDNKMEKDFATFAKKKCDAELTGTWHVVAGRNFGCSITHETKHVLFFQVDQMHFLVFKSLD